MKRPVRIIVAFLVLGIAGGFLYTPFILLRDALEGGPTFPELVAELFKRPNVALFLFGACTIFGGIIGLFFGAIVSFVDIMFRWAWSDKP